MKTPLHKVSRFIDRHAMLDGATGVLVAVSGGPDSVVLLDMLIRLSMGDRGCGLGVREGQSGGGPAEQRSRGAEEQRRSGASPLCSSAPPHLDPSPFLPLSTSPPLAFSPSGIPTLHVAHLDHMLRDGESAEDTEFVRALAKRLGLQITIRSADVRAAASRSGRGIEEIAREIRYAFLLAAANEAGCDRIAVGHTMSDQAETFLMRLIRGAGLRGLAAMRPVSAVPVFPQEKAEGRRQNADDESLPSADRLLPSVLLVRPMLCITREEVEGYARERDLEFRTDSTNQDVHYTRNRLRNAVLPALRSINPRVVESISRAAENAGGDQDLLDGLALSLLRNARLASQNWPHIVDGSFDAYSVGALLEQPAAMRRRMIIEAIRLTREDASGGQRDASGEITSTHISAVEGLLALKASGKHVSLPGSLEVWREFDALVIKLSGSNEATYQTVISSECPDVEAAGFALSLQRGLPVELLESVIEGTRREKQLTGRDWMTVGLDDRVLPEHLSIRPRYRGERAHVIGRQGTIKLKNLMIDHRIPSSRRATWPLVTTPDGAYIWSPGLPPALEFAAHDETQMLAIMRASAI